jgi:hypothetical protein
MPRFISSVFQFISGAGEKGPKPCTPGLASTLLNMSISVSQARWKEKPNRLLALEALVRESRRQGT